MTSSTDGQEMDGFEPEFSLTVGMAAYVYGIPAEVFIHALHAGLIAGRVDSDGDVLITCNSLVAGFGDASYNHWN